MTFRDTWHADGDVLDRYASGSLDSARAMSVEAHLPSCEECRSTVARRADHTRLRDTWTAVAGRVDRPHQSLLERALRTLGVKETTARLLGATPSLRLPFVLSSATVLLLAVLAAGAGPGTGSPGGAALGMLLVLAPVLPVVGVALAYGRHADAAYELTVATPTPGCRLLLVRSVVVLLTSILTGALAAAAIPGAGIEAAAWMLPALALTTSTLALSTWLPVRTAAAGVGAAWIALTIAGLRLTQTGLARPRLNIVVNEAVFRPSGQLVCAAIAAVAVAVALTRHDTVESEVSA